MTTSALAQPEQALREKKLADKRLTINAIASLYGDSDRARTIGQLIFDWCKDGRIVAMADEIPCIPRTLIMAVRVGSRLVTRPRPKKVGTYTEYRVNPAEYAKALETGLADLLPLSSAAVLRWLGESAKTAQAVLHAAPDTPGDEGEVPVKLARLQTLLKLNWVGMDTDIKKAATNGLKAATWRDGHYYVSACRKWINAKDAEFEATGRGKRRWVDIPKEPCTLVMARKR